MNKLQREQDQASFRYSPYRHTLSIRQSNRNSRFNSHRNLSGSQQNGADRQADLKRVLIIDNEFEVHIKNILSQPVTDQCIPYLLQCLLSPQTQRIIQGTIGIRRVLSKHNAPIPKIIQADIDSILIELASHSCLQVQLQSCWALANIACGDDGQCEGLLKKGVVKCFKRCLDSPNKYVAEQAVWGIGNLASDSIQIRDALLEEGLIQDFAKTILSFQDKYIIQITCWAISNLCRNLPLPTYSLVENGLILLVCMIEGKCIEDQSILTDCLNTFTEHLKHQQGGMRSILGAKVVECGVGAFSNGGDRLVLVCLRLMGYLIGSDLEINRLVFGGVVEHGAKLLEHRKAAIRKEACYLLSILALSSEECALQILCQKEMMSTLAKMLLADDLQVKLEILQFFVSLTEHLSGLSELCRAYSLMQQIVELLKEDDLYVVLRAAHFLNRLLLYSEEQNNQQQMVNELRNCNGLVLLSRLRECQSGKIREIVFRIIGRFLSGEEMDEIYI